MVGHFDFKHSCLVEKHSVYFGTFNLATAHDIVLTILTQNNFTLFFPPNLASRRACFLGSTRAGCCRWSMITSKVNASSEKLFKNYWWHEMATRCCCHCYKTTAVYKTLTVKLKFRSWWLVTTPASLLVSYSFFEHLRYRNCRLQRDLNSDRQSRRRARWPL